MPTPQHGATSCSSRVTRLALAAAAACALASPAVAATGKTQVCNTDSVLKSLEGLPRFVAALQQAVLSQDCDSVVAVIKQLAQSKKVGGRKLQEPSALDQQAAQREWQAARADAEFAQRLAAAQQAETDPLRRQLIEAALLHEYGHYRARDLQLQQIAAAAGS